MPRKPSKFAEWARRTKDELNGISGIAGLGGTVLGAGSLTFLSGLAATLLSGGGAVIVVGAVGYAAVKAIPPPRRKAEDYVGRVVGLDDLDLFEASLISVAIVGPSMAGKTTLRSRLAIEQAENIRTQMTSAKIVCLQTTPQTYLALLDGGGERLAQQFAVSANGDILIVVVDHSSSDRSGEIDQERLRDNSEMLRQVRLFLDEKTNKKKTDIVFLVNKRDLWGVKAEAEFVFKFYEEIANAWRAAHKAEQVKIHPFSNNKPEDLAVLMADIKLIAQRRAVIV